MERVTEEEVRLLLRRTGMTLSLQELGRLTEVFRKTREQLEALHAADLRDEEVAGLFPPGGEGAAP